MSKKEEAKDEAKEPEFVMEFRKLGGTGLIVSCLGLGMMSVDSVDQLKSLMKAARPNSNGCNFFDNAELYGEPVGEAETIFGKALKELQKEDPQLWRRSELVITTKIFFSPANGKLENGYGLFSEKESFGANELGLSKKRVYEGMKGSLKRLDMDYVDVVYAHASDQTTPILEVVQAFNDVINRGQALYWGTSNWSPIRIIEAYWIAKLHNLIPPICEQASYSMLERSKMEKWYLPLFKNPYNYGTTTYSPLAAGYLTGKYIDGIPKGSRFDKDNNRLSKWWSNLDKTKVEKSKKLLEIAKELNVTLVELALAWCLKNKNVSCLILGGRKAEQITQNLGCIKVAMKLTKDDMDKIEKVLDNKPAIEFPQGIPNKKVKKLIDTQ